MFSRIKLPAVIFIGTYAAKSNDVNAMAAITAAVASLLTVSALMSTLPL